MFNKINSKVLKFDTFKEIEKIKFNHYIMRKENINRLKGEFSKGQFSLSVSLVSRDFNISRSKAYRMIKEFEELEIIRCVFKGDLNNKHSVYEYVVDSDLIIKTKTKTSCDTNNKTRKTSDLNTFKSFSEIDEKTNDEIIYETSKKDIYKKDLEKDNIYINIINYLNKRTGKSFKHTTIKTKSYINARLKDGFCEEDFYKVIDIKCRQWLFSDMSRFLRPMTLFSNKFEAYLNEESVISFNRCEDEREVDDNIDIDFNYMN